MVARRAVTWACVAVVLLAGWVPAAAIGRYLTGATKHPTLSDQTTAPASPMVLDQVDRGVPSPQKLDPTQGFVSWSVVRSRPIWLTSTEVLSRCLVTHCPNTLQALHCLLSV